MTTTDERPSPPPVGYLNTPYDLIRLHWMLNDQATYLERAGGHREAVDEWHRAAKRLASLAGDWQARIHVTPACNAMRSAANQAVEALLEALCHAGQGEYTQSDRWFTVADNWADNLRIQAPDIRELPSTPTEPAPK